MQTSERKSALTQPTAVQGQPDAIEGGNGTPGDSIETKITITKVEDSKARARDNLQLEVLDIEMKSPESDFPSSSIDYEPVVPSATVSEKEQNNTKEIRDIDIEKRVIKACSSVCEEEKMDTETSSPEERTADQISNPNPENVCSTESNQVNTEQFALFRDNEITSFKQNEESSDTTSLSTERKENAAETQHGQLKEAINKEEEISKIDDSKMAAAIDSEDVQNASESGFERQDNALTS